MSAIATEKAKFTHLNRDLFWRLYTLEDGSIRWTGYDDSNWWDNVAPKVRDRKGEKSFHKDEG